MGPLALAVDVYLLPAVVGGGLGDIEEVLAAGRTLERHGARPILFRQRGRPLPKQVDGPWRWPAVRRVRTLTPDNSRAVTVAASWGISAAPKRDEPLGRPGTWDPEVREIEATYGPERTLHVSFEEFGRTLTVRDQERERLREGGVPSAELAGRLKSWSRSAAPAAMRAAYRRFRAFDRPNVVHLFCTFARSEKFAREFPEAVQTGPLWPEPSHLRDIPPRTRKAVVPRSHSVVWYASPASSIRIATGVVRGLTSLPESARLTIRSPRSFDVPSGTKVTVEWLSALAPARWERLFRAADLRIVTGSRTLLEAIRLGGPFLYFNGILGEGRAARRHRPEKVVGLLRAWRAAGASRSWCTAVGAFARGQSVAPVVRRAIGDRHWQRSFPPTPRPTGFRAPYHDAGATILGAVRMFAGGATSAETVQRARKGELPPVEDRLASREP